MTTAGPAARRRQLRAAPAAAAQRLTERVGPLVRRELAGRAGWRQGRGVGDRRTMTWPAAVLSSHLRHRHVTCNICGWQGHAFEGERHSESGVCPSCASVARDRFLLWCWTQRVPYDPMCHLLETSPRMTSMIYHAWMAGIVDYLSSDHDGSSHRAMINLDLQSNWLRAESLDIVLSAHVLEHVPDPAATLVGLHRVLAPGGSLFLQVPLPQPSTGKPGTPEYHGDRTLVHWRFGWDLRDLVLAAGFAEATWLVTAELADAAATARHGASRPPADLDEAAALIHAAPTTLTVVADHAQTARHGFQLAHQMITLHATRD